MCGPKGKSPAGPAAQPSPIRQLANAMGLVKKTPVQETNPDVRTDANNTPDTGGIIFPDDKPVTPVADGVVSLGAKKTRKKASGIDL